MRPAPPVHSKNMDPVLLSPDHPFKLSHHIPQLPVSQETFIHRLLSASTVSLQEITHIVKPPVVSDVVCNEIERPVHGNRINEILAGVSKRNVSEMFLFSELQSGE